MRNVVSFGGGLSMDVGIHLGAHRTASTLFQNWMGRNTVALLQADVGFWGPRRTRNGLFAGLLRPVTDPSDGDRKASQRAVGRVRMELNRAKMSGARDVVISDPSLIGALGPMLYENLLYPELHARLARFAPAIGGDTLRIGLGIRNYDTFWASALAETVQSGHDLRDSDGLDMLVTQPRRWRHVIEDIVDVFPEAEVIVWSHEAWGSQPDAQLTALLGRAQPLRKCQDHQRPMAAPTAAQLADFVEDHGNLEGAEELRAMDGRYMPFDAEQSAKLRADYDADIAWLRQGADGLATYMNPAGETFGGEKSRRRWPLDKRGRPDDRFQKRVG